MFLFYLFGFFFNTYTTETSELLSILKESKEQNQDNSKDGRFITIFENSAKKFQDKFSVIMGEYPKEKKELLFSLCFKSIAQNTNISTSTDGQASKQKFVNQDNEIYYDVDMDGLFKLYFFIAPATIYSGPRSKDDLLEALFEMVLITYGLRSSEQLNTIHVNLKSVVSRLREHNSEENENIKIYDSNENESSKPGTSNEKTNTNNTSNESDTDILIKKFKAAFGKSENNFGESFNFLQKFLCENND